jgi:hypothetical protein
MGAGQPLERTFEAGGRDADLFTEREREREALFEWSSTQQPMA